MPLPFGRHDGKRQFQCFVCGVIQPDFNSFKEHVRGNHEEGREYIVCPLDHCKAPVRDLRAHFKACHKHTPCPHDRQLKALVWKDPKDPRKKKKKISFEEGYFPSAKNRRKLHYDSSWEREVFEVLEKMEDVVRYEKEPVAIEYFFDGERKNYLPDLKLYFRDGHKEIWEVKPLNQTNLAVNEAKWHSCGEFCKKRGWDFKIITEVGLARLKNDLRLDKKD
jgi:hypothetical protein